MEEANQTETLSDPPTGTALTLSIHADSNPERHALALGLQLALEESLLAAGNVDVVPLDKIQEVGKKTDSFLEESGQLTTKNLPMLGLTLKTDQVLIVRLDIDANGAVSALVRNFNPATLLPRNTLQVALSGNDWPGFAAALLDAVQRSLGFRLTAEPPVFSGIDRDSLVSWGRLWLSKDDVPSAMAHLKRILFLGDLRPKVAGRYFTKTLNAAFKNAGKPGTYLKKSFLGEPKAWEALASLRSEALKKPEEKTEELAWTFLYENRDGGACRKPEDKAAKKVLADLAKAYKKAGTANALLNYHAGRCLYSQGLESEALAAWSKALPLDVPDTETLRILAEKAADDETKLAAEDGLLAAYESRFSDAEAEALRLRRFLIAPTVEVARALHPERWSEEQRQVVYEASKTATPETKAMLDLMLLLAEAARQEKLGRDWLEGRLAPLASSLQDDAMSFLVGRFLVERLPDIDRIEKYLLNPAKRDDALGREASLWLALGYLKTGTYDKAVSAYRKLAKDEAPDETQRERLTDALIGANRHDEALEELNALLAVRPDCARLLLKKVDLLTRMKKPEEAEAVRKDALALNHILAESMKAQLEAEEKAKEEQAKKAEAEQAEKPVVVKKDLAKLSLKWEELKPVMEKFPALAGKVGLVLPDQFSKPFLDSLPAYVMEPFHLDTEPLARDIEKLVKYQYAVVDLKEHSFSDSGLGRFPVETMQSFIKSKKLSGVVVAQISQKESGALSVGLSLVLPDEPKPLFFTADVASHLSELLAFNLAILILPLLVMALLVLQSLKKRKAGTGSVAVRVTRDPQDGAGYYGARVSQSKLKQAFRVDTILEKAGVGGDKVDVAAMIKGQFDPWWATDRKSIVNDAVRFDKLSVGDWFLYIGGLTVDYRTGKAVGTFEMERRFTVKRDQETALAIDMTTTEVYLEVKVLLEEIRETAAKKKADEKKKKDKDKKKEAKDDAKKDKKAEPEIVQKQYVKEVKVINGAKVQLNKNPDQTIVTEQGRGASFYVERNRYLVTATYEGMAAFQIVEINDTAAQFVELFLKPATEVEFPVVPEPLKSLADQAKAPTQPELPITGSPAGKATNLAVMNAVPMPPNYMKTPPPTFDMEEEEIGIDLDQSTYVPDPPSGSPAPKAEPVPGAKATPTVRSEVISGDLGGGLDALFDTATPGKESVRSEYSADPKVRARELEKHGKFKEAGELYIELGDLDKAIDCCQRADDPDLNYKLYGLNYLKDGKYQEALEMFRQIGDMLLQAASLEGMRMFEEANLLRADYFQQHGQSIEAAEAFEKAGKFAKAADLYLKLDKPQKAADSYFKAREYEKAAGLYQKLGQRDRLAISYEMAGKYMLAAAEYKELGQHEKVCDMWLSAGHLLHAAEGYKRLGLVDKAKDICENIETDHQHFLETQMILAQILREEGNAEFASDLVREIVEDAEIEEENLPRYFKFAAAIQQAGMRSDAYFIFRKLQIAAPDYPDLAERVKALSLRADEPDDIPVPAPAPVAPTAPPAYSQAASVAAVASQEEEESPPMPPADLPPPMPEDEDESDVARTNPKIPRLDSDDDIHLPEPSEPKLIGPDGRKRSSSGRYVFEGEIGRGAMGIVFKAKDTVLGRSVAYKTVSNAIKDNPAALKYFLSEAKSLAALNHQNIVTIFDVGQEDGNYFLTMEFVEGQSLSALIKKKRRLSIKNTVIILSKICQGLEYAHQQNVIHRDIKPSNIMISNKGEVKIMDFGLAKIVNKAMQDRTLVRGTPLYMSPEQVHGDGIGRRSDIYSLGITVFEMCTGTLPFTKGDIGYHHMHTQPPRPSQFNAAVPESLENLILTCLAKNKDDRYPSVTELRKALVPLRQNLAK